MTEDADVAVVGGGIAGAAACIALARSGLRILWSAPRHDSGADRIGESLAPAARQLLAGLGVAQLIDGPGHRQSNATFSAWGVDALVERNAAAHHEGPGRVLDRAQFEQDLQAAARTVCEPCPAGLVAAMPTSGRWQLDLTDGSTATAAFLIDASGRGAAVARGVGRLRRDDRLLAACALLPHRDQTVEPTPATLIEAVEYGWWYAALLPDGRLSLAYFSDPDLLPRGLSRDLDVWRRLIDGSRHIARWIDDAGFAVEAPPRLHSAGTTWLEPPAGEQEGAPWAAIGDAAAAFDPLSSHGMTTALWAGARMGEAVPARLAGDRRPLASYAHAVGEGITAFRDQRAAIYARERRFPESAFWRRRRPSTAADGRVTGSRRAG